MHTHGERPHTKISRYVALVQLICRLEAGAEMEEGANAFDRDPCEGAMELWWVFGTDCRFQMLFLSWITDLRMIGGRNDDGLHDQKSRVP